MNFSNVLLMADANYEDNLLSIVASRQICSSHKMDTIFFAVESMYVIFMLCFQLLLVIKCKNKDLINYCFAIFKSY